MSDESSTQEMERIRQMADKLDCMIEEDFCLLANATPGTVEAWRKRGTGPAYIRLGRRYLYPYAAFRRYMDSLIRERISDTGFAAPEKDLL